MSEKITEEDSARTKELINDALSSLEGSSLEELFLRHKETVEGFKNFDNLQAIEGLRVLWQDRGCSPDDPINYVIEAIGIYDTRMRAAIGQSVAINETQASFMLLTHRQVVDLIAVMEDGLQRIDEIKAAVVLTQRLSATMDGCVSEIKKDHAAMLDIVEEFAGAVGEATFAQRALNWSSYGIVAVVFAVVGAYIF